MLGDIGRWSNYLVAGIFVLVGLYLLGIIKLELPGAANAKTRGKGAWAGFVLGLLFGLALGPCTFAYMAPILAIVLAKSSTSLVYGVPLAAGLRHRPLRRDRLRRHLHPGDRELLALERELEGPRPGKKDLRHPADRCRGLHDLELIMRRRLY